MSASTRKTKELASARKGSTPAATAAGASPVHTLARGSGGSVFTGGSNEIIQAGEEEEDETNFQKASCTLEAGVKIYSLHVDSVHSEAGVLFDSFETPDKCILSDVQTEKAELIDLSFAKEQIEQMVVHMPPCDENGSKLIRRVHAMKTATQ